MNMNKKAIIVYCLLLLFFVGAFFAYGKYEADNKIKKSNSPANSIDNLPINTANVTNATNTSNAQPDPKVIKKDVELPTIKRSDIPDPSEFYGGTGDKNGEYDTVLIDDIATEEPVSMVYSVKDDDLHFKSDKEIFDIYSVDDKKLYADIGADMMKDLAKSFNERSADQILKYGQIARQYLPDDIIWKYHESDIDNDGEQEKLITLTGFESNHWPDYAQVVKNNKIIFSADLNYDGAGIMPAKNGFYVEWGNDESFQDENGNWTGYCCPANHHKTLFEFQNGKLVPIKQWKVNHIWKKVIEG